MKQYYLPTQQSYRYSVHGIASVPLSRLDWGGAVINLEDLHLLPKVRYAWIKGNEVKISSGRNQSPPSALEISADQPLSGLVVLPHRFHASDRQEYERFLRSLGEQFGIFETKFGSFDGIRIAIEPVYSS